MSTLHRSDSAARRHYSIDQKSFTTFTPSLLYSGKLTKMEGWKDALHSHDFLEIIFILDGIGTITIDDLNYKVMKGDILIYNAGIMHHEDNAPEAPMEARFAAFHKIQLKNLPANCILPPKSKCIFKAGKLYSVLISLFDMINIEITEKNEFYLEIVESISKTLLMYIFRIINQEQGCLELVNKETLLMDILNYIDCNFTNDIGLAEIASECFINKYYVSHLFADHLGMTVGQYIRNKRIELAKKLLIQTDDPISVIAEKCGFHDTNYFGRLFKIATSTTLLKFRKNH